MGALRLIALRVLFGSCAKTAGCDGTERPSDDQEADTLPGCTRALSGNHRVGSAGGSEVHGVIR